MKDPEISAMGALALVLGFSLAMVFGYMFAGWIGALTGAIFAATAAVVAQYRQSSRKGQLEGRVLPMDGLTPEQMIGVLSAQTGGTPGGDGNKGDLKSEVLTKLEAAIEGADLAPKVALARVEQIRDEHPRSPAVWAELVRRRLSVDADDAWDALRRAVELALDGGMNPMAAKLVEEFPEGRDALELDAKYMTRLQRVFEHRNDRKLADWARKFT